MKLSNVLLIPLNIKSSHLGRALAGAVLLSICTSGWAGEHSRSGEGHKDRHRNNESHHGDHRRDNHREHRRDSERHHDRHREARRDSQHQKHRHHGGKTRHDVHREHRNHDRHHHQVTPKRYSHHHRKYHRKHHTRHGHSDRHSSHEAAFLLGGVILGAVLSDVNHAADDFYYDGRAARSYRNLRTETCYRSYYENGRRILVEASRDFCRAY